MRKDNPGAHELGRKVAVVEKSLLHGNLLLARVVEGLQKDFSLFDFGLFFDGYNKEIEKTKCI